MSQYIAWLSVKDTILCINIQQSTSFGREINGFQEICGVLGKLIMKSCYKWAGGKKSIEIKNIEQKNRCNMRPLNGSAMCAESNKRTVRILTTSNHLSVKNC